MLPPVEIDSQTPMEDDVPLLEGSSPHDTELTPATSPITPKFHRAGRRYSAAIFTEETPTKGVEIIEQDEGFKALQAPLKIQPPAVSDLALPDSHQRSYKMRKMVRQYGEGEKLFNVIQDFIKE